MPESQETISRRTLLKAGGAVGAVALAGGAISAIANPGVALAEDDDVASEGIGVQNAFWFDAEACVGCQTCAATCKATYQLDKAYRSVYLYSDGGTPYSVSVGCSFCGHAACIAVCPTGAMHRTEDYGHVVVDASKCIGCGYCDMACPYGIPRVDKEVGHSVKCDGCYNVVRHGDLPACVQSCPEDALKFGTLQDMIQLGGEQANIAPLPDPSYTSPSFIISAGKDMPPAGTTEGEILNLGAML